MPPAMPPAPEPFDLVVVGGGPAGRALAHRAAVHGLAAAVVDPAPDRPWPATYGAWADELPAWLPTGVVAATVDRPVAVGRRHHQLDRTYVVLDTPALQAALSAGDAAVVARAAVGVRRPAGRRRAGRRRGLTQVVLAGGGTVAGRVVVDASGAARRLSGGAPPPPRAAQTAVGLVVPTPPGHPTLFMDWRADHGEAGWPSFLYAIPLGGGRLLVEETSLARRPGLDRTTLRRRLDARLAARGIDVPDDAGVEHVAFTVDTPLTRGVGPVVPFGAAAPLVHPATGYSLAAALGLVDPLLDAVAATPDDPVGAARAVVWPPAARAVHHLRRRGLEVLLALPPADVPGFFDTFFDLPADLQAAYTSGRADLAGTARAMTALFTAADGRLRRHLVRHGLSLGETADFAGRAGRVVRSWP